jgi:phospholipid/cholesterol/gamma-HCH transport system substrate-binding protein
MRVHDLPRRFKAGFGCVGVLLLVAGATIALRYGQGYFEPGYELTAVFPSSSQGLYTDGGSDVKLRGLDVGTVRGIELLDDGRVEITLFMDDGVEVPDTAVASIEPLSVFGPKFIRIAPGEHEGTEHVLRPGDEIEHTLAPVELTEILASATRLFEDIDPQDLITVLDEIADGVSGLGPEIGRSIDAAGELLEVGAAHDADTRAFLGDLAALATELADHAGAARSITEDLATVLPVLTEEPDRLGDLLDATSAISASFADLLADNAHQIDTSILAVATFVAGVDERASEIPAFVDLIGSFFGRLSDVIRFEAPAGKQMAGLRGFIALDLCLVYGVCPLGPAVDADIEALAAAPPTPTTPGPFSPMLDLLLGAP